MRPIVAVLLSLTLTACATTSPTAGKGEMGAEAEDLLSFMTPGRPKGAAFDALVAEAAKHPLGSRQNPVRVNRPEGQRAYLGRLRCSDGLRPQFSRRGSVGFGVFGSILDDYDVRCATGTPAQSTIYMDMYHPTHVERAAPPGFTIVPAS